MPWIKIAIVAAIFAAGSWCGWYPTHLKCYGDRKADEWVQANHAVAELDKRTAWQAEAAQRIADIDRDAVAWRSRYDAERRRNRALADWDATLHPDFVRMYVNGEVPAGASPAPAGANGTAVPGHQ